MVKDWIGLSWDVPKLPSLSLSKSRDSELNPKEPDIAGLWSPKEQSIHGFFVPSSDPRKLNQLLRKHAIDTAGSNWFDMPALAMSAELKKDLQLLKLRNVTRKGIIRSETPSRRRCPRLALEVGKAPR